MVRKRPFGNNHFAPIDNFFPPSNCHIFIWQEILFALSFPLSFSTVDMSVWVEAVSQVLQDLSPSAFPGVRDFFRLILAKLYFFFMSWLVAFSLLLQIRRVKVTFFVEIYEDEGNIISVHNEIEFPWMLIVGLRVTENHHLSPSKRHVFLLLSFSQEEIKFSYLRDHCRRSLFLFCPSVWQSHHRDMFLIEMQGTRYSGCDKKEKLEWTSSLEFNVTEHKCNLYFPL